MPYSTEFKNIETFIHTKAQDHPDFAFSDKPFYYVVPMFPYPSGNIHMGHIRNYSISNAIARYKKSQGYNVLHPIGFDSFGLPAEAAAIKHGVSAKDWTEKNIGIMTQDFKNMGFDFDWGSCVKTHEFDYYHFEQDIFKEAWTQGYIYKKDKFVNYDPVDNTILSNEQVINGKGWRSGAAVVRKKVPMYFFDMRRYAKELNDGLAELAGSKTMPGWPQKVIDMQRNWIGLVEGQDITFSFTKFTKASPDPVSPDTNSVAQSITAFKAQDITVPRTVVVGINHSFVKEIENTPEFKAWFDKANQGSVSQKNTFKDKSWFTSQWAVNYQGQGIPICVDINRDEEAVMVAEAVVSDNYNPTYIGAYQSEVDTTFIGLKDWCISRQRYWGNPIPMVECVDCKDVPSTDYVRLPEDLRPDGQGNILDKTPNFTECACPQCGKAAKRSTDTMDTFVQSAWYYHRYINPSSPKIIPKPDTQIDTYIGGVEHATLHLIYTRFFHKMLRDLGYVSTNEPIKKLITQGMVCKKYQKTDGSWASAKMSKSLGNVVAPQEYIDKYGADAVQMFMIFAAPPSDNFDFDSQGMVGTYRFLEEVYRYFFEDSTTPPTLVDKDAVAAIEKLTQYTQREFEGRGNLNTVIPQIMVAFKALRKTGFQSVDIQTQCERDFVQALGIFAPHLGEYINAMRYDKKQENKYEKRQEKRAP